jgi:5-methyltetrahydropteroyltriglutamate--homocysteine methyltransferase
MAADGRPPCRADHIGSLLRPAALRQAFRRHAAGELDDAGFALIQDHAIRAVVLMQEEVGLKVATDGEFRRGSYWSRFVERTEGLAVRDAIFTFRDAHGHEQAFTAPHVTGPVRRGAPIALDEFTFLSAATTALAKATLPAPSTMHFWRGARYADPGVYGDARDFFRDLGAVYRAEIAALAAAGCRYVQLDEVALAMLCDGDVRARVAAEGGDAAALVRLYVEAINEAVAARPPGVTVGVHMCRGNFKGRYLAEGGYEAVAETVFHAARVDHFLLEFDTPRAGDFAPLRLVPEDKGVVLGLVSTKVPALEPLDLLRRRVDEAARYLDQDRLAISPQCGFASTVAGNPVEEADERAKLARVVEAAAAIWQDA